MSTPEFVNFSYYVIVLPSDSYLKFQNLDLCFLLIILKIMANINKKMQKLIDEIVDKIVQEYNPKKIILFGSYAYGKPTADSDIDLLIIKNTDKRPLDRWLEVKKILRNPQRSISISPLVYTEKEIEHRLFIKDFFLEEIFQKGKTLYG